MKKTFTVLVLFVALIAVLLELSVKSAQRFHSSDELAKLKILTRGSTGPHATNNLFGGSGLCGGCHGFDPVGYAMVTPWGEDVNIYDDWAGTMMANSAKDPLWRAKVSHEILVNPGLSTEIENKCTSCHAPLGHFNAFFNGDSTYAISDLVSDSLARDGVSCGACHAQKDTLIGKLNSGNLIYDTTKTVYGPFNAPFAGPMESFEGFKVKKGNHVTRAGFCATCHTLITGSYDLSGVATGTTFVEQATYHEWVNSQYNDEVFTATGKTCQHCHLPRIDENIVIAANFSFLTGRRPYGQHKLVGANSFMLKLMQNNRSALGITATNKNFDSSIVSTNRMMKDSAVIMNLRLINRTVDTAYYDLKLTNYAGHKFPSGYPSRRAFVQFVLLNAIGDTIFKNGMLNSAYQLIGQDATYEPHHNIINTENDVQIYEMVAGDILGGVTTVLERMYSHLKDNRLTPKGFSTSHYNYDTVEIAGEALTDADFNYDSLGVEGSGSDIVHFRVPLAGYTGALNVSASLYYQSVPHKWLDEMFTFTSPEITAFQGMFNSADHTPLLVAFIHQGAIYAGLNNTINNNFDVKVFPNPSTTGIVNVFSNFLIDEINVFSIDGKKELTIKNASQFVLQRRGTYIVVVKAGGKQKVEKIIYR